MNDPVTKMKIYHTSLQIYSYGMLQFNEGIFYDITQGRDISPSSSLIAYVTGFPWLLDGLFVLSFIIDQD